MARHLEVENKGKEPEIRIESPDSISVGMGVLWIVVTAAAWIVALVLFSLLMARL